MLCHCCWHRLAMQAEPKGFKENFCSFGSELPYQNVVVNNHSTCSDAVSSGLALLVHAVFHSTRVPLALCMYHFIASVLAARTTGIEQSFFESDTKVYKQWLGFPADTVTNAASTVLSWHNRTILDGDL